MKSTLSPWIANTLMCFAVLAAPAQQAAPKAPAYTVLYTFTGGSDGALPNGVIQDEAGSLYGTTLDGGDLSCASPGFLPGCGVVFRLGATGTETVLHTFEGPTDGAFPTTSIIRDDHGALYGTTAGGGAAGQGVVYKLRLSGKQTVLYSFTGGPDGAGQGFSVSGLLQDDAGNFYGTTFGGGTFDRGVVFKVDSAGHETALYSFTGGTDGQSPQTSLVRDGEGNLYGTTTAGGDSGYGVVFKLDLVGKETVLYSFTGGADGGVPIGTLVRDKEGNLYGTTGEGGDLNGFCGDLGPGCGTVFKLTSCRKGHLERENCSGEVGDFTVLHTFTGEDGALPYGGLVRDEAGNIYGTALFGGDLNGACGGFCGVVYKLDRAGTVTVLHSFTGGADGGNPYTETLVLDAAHKSEHDEANVAVAQISEDSAERRKGASFLYGTTQMGGILSTSGTAGQGVVFKLTLPE